jgi:FkbM family methyltransferase
MKKQFLRWAFGRAVRAMYRERSVTRRGDTGAPFTFRPSENPVLLKGPSRVNAHLRVQWAAVLRPDDVIFDIGANIGFTVQRFYALLGKEGRIVAFEPMPRNLELLAGNVGALESGSVEIVRKAVGSEVGTATFQQNRKHGALSRMESAVEQAVERYDGYWRSFEMIEVEVTTVDAYVEDHPEARPTFLKIDVEGAGGMVLAGAKETIRRFRPAMDCEFHGDGERSAMLTVLREHGYCGVHVDPNGMLRLQDLDDTTTIYVHPDDSRLAGHAQAGGTPAVEAR